MFDLHCHILPGVDDGPADSEGALAMARVLSALGFTTITASPHVGDGPGGNVPRALAESRRVVLQAELERHGIELCILPSAEHMIGPELFDRLASCDVTPIGGRGQWLFVEFPWIGIADPEKAVFRLQARGWRLLLAHPERHEYIDRALVARLADRGVRFQLELGSFVGRYGDRAREVAIELAKLGHGHVLASDLHHHEGALEWLGAALSFVRKKLGEEALCRALVTGPKVILADRSADELLPFVEQR